MPRARILIILFVFSLSTSRPPHEHVRRWTLRPTTPVAPPPHRAQEPPPVVLPGPRPCPTPGPLLRPRRHRPPLPTLHPGALRLSQPPPPSSASPSTPTPTLAHFVAYALHRTRLHPSVTFTALFLLSRLKSRFPAARGSSGHRLFISAFMIASKVVCDDTYSNKSWTVVGQGMFSLREINQMEREMCGYLDWILNIPPKDLVEFDARVRKEYAPNGPCPPFVHPPQPAAPAATSSPATPVDADAAASHMHLTTSAASVPATPPAPPTPPESPDALVCWAGIFDWILVLFLAHWIPAHIYLTSQRAAACLIYTSPAWAGVRATPCRPVSHAASRFALARSIFSISVGIVVIYLHLYYTHSIFHDSRLSERGASRWWTHICLDNNGIDNRTVCTYCSASVGK
ncbi:hypothetical protein JB92DRAFT_1629761 [Gautieria morchelliformis]|nr:hypothetical protein JB92DRAFT_1629761 [Gautieria morchelliformis]